MSIRGDQCDHCGQPLVKGRSLSYDHLHLFLPFDDEPDLKPFPPNPGERVLQQDLPRLERPGFRMFAFCEECLEAFHRQIF